MKIVDKITTVLEQQANNLYKARQYEKAIFVYEQVLNLDSKNARVWNNKGLCLANLARHMESIVCYDKALIINPKHLFALRNRSISLIKLGEYENALASIHKALEIDPKSIVDLNNKTLCENELIKIFEEKKKINEEVTKKQEEEKKKQEKERREFERNQATFNSNLTELIREIEISADEKPCPKCNELEVLILSLSPNARSLSVRCNHCRHEYRIKMEPDNSEKIIQLFNSFSEGKGLYSRYGDDAVPFWRMEIKRRQSTNQRKPIPSSVKKAVWKRDGGRCVNCGSDIDIEYDHIIPVAKGGSSTVQNIQILCQKCNRKKSASIE